MLTVCKNKFKKHSSLFLIVRKKCFIAATPGLVAEVVLADGGIVPVSVTKVKKNFLIVNLNFGIISYTIFRQTDR